VNEDELLRLLTQGEEELKLAFREVIAYLRETNQLDSVIEAVQAGRMDLALRQVDTAAAHIAGRIEALYTRSAMETARVVTMRGNAGLVTFQASNPEAVRQMQALRLDKIREFSEQQRDMVRQALTRGLSEGRNPRAIARDIRESIGLTAKQEAIVDNYRRQLESGEWAAARARRLHDDRYNRAFDGAVRRAQGLEPMLSEAQIDRMVDNYRRSWINLRAETIARTEALRAVHMGQDELYRQAIDEGQLDAQKLVCTWHAGLPPRTRDWHASMNNQRRPWGVPFTSGHGNSLLYPGDPRAPGEETSNCRCARSVKVAA